MRTKLNYIVYFNTFLLSLLWICLLDSTYSKENKNESQQLLRSSPASENVDEVILEDFIHSLDSNFSFFIKAILGLFYNVFANYRYRKKYKSNE